MFGWAEALVEETDEDRRRRLQEEAEERRLQNERLAQFRVTATHEAGHHAVARSYGVQLEPARLYFDAGPGEVAGRGGGGYFDGDWPDFNDAVVAVSGALSCGSWSGADDDWARARAGVRASGRTMGEAKAEARRRLRAQAAQIRRDADALFQRGWA